jgi:DNA-binding GntR family transcriptional regulator
MSKSSLSTTQMLRDELENDLTERFGVSRTPVREALQQLAAIGLVEMVPNRGAFVARIGLAELVEMFEVMAELEGMCARLATRRISESEADALREALSACGCAAESGDSDAYYYENDRFHECIYTASHNSFLRKQTRQLKTRLQPYRRMQLQVPNRVKRSMEEHHAIVKAILAGDERQAESCIKQHVQIQGERFMDFVASVGGLPE